jgi:hypothetical protein
VGRYTPEWAHPRPTLQVQVAFYRRVADPSSPFATLLPVPKPIVCEYRRLFNAVLLVLELIPPPFATIPDHVGADAAAIEALLAGAARLHARFWRLPVAELASTSFLYDRKGLSFLNVVPMALSMHKAPAWSVKVRVSCCAVVCCALSAVRTCAVLCSVVLRCAALCCAALRSLAVYFVVLWNVCVYRMT